MKSHVSLEQAQCPVCGAVFSTGSLLLDKHLQSSMEMHTVTHFDLCPEHKALWDDGFVAFIEVEPDSPRSITEARRTGLLMHMHKSVAEQVFSATFPHPIAFIERGIIDQLKASIKQAPESEPVLETPPSVIVPLH